MSSEDRSPQRQKSTLVFMGLLVSIFQAATSQTVFSPALPIIAGELHDAVHVLWILSGFILASTISIPAYGKLGDLVGHKQPLIVAISLFMAGSVLGGLSPDVGWLIGSRIIQGLGAGGMIVLSQAATARAVAPRLRGKFVGIIGATFAVASVVGPLLGGWLTEGPGWRWIFWVNVPTGLIAIATVGFFMDQPHRKNVRGGAFDIRGMFLLAAATTCIVLVATWGGTQYEWESPIILVLAGSAVIAAGTFGFYSSRTIDPVIPRGLFRNRNFNLTTAAGIMTSLALFGVIGYMPSYLQMTMALPPTATGLLMIPMMGALLVSSVISGATVSKLGRYKLAPIAGSAIFSGGLVLLSSTSLGTPLWMICLFLAIMGTGLGMTVQILTLIVQNSFPASMLGTATASTSFIRQIGATLGTAVTGALFTSRLESNVKQRLPETVITAFGGIDALTPTSVQSFVETVRTPILESYNAALMPLFLYISPGIAFGAMLLCFVVDRPPGTSGKAVGRSPGGPPHKS